MAFTNTTTPIVYYGGKTSLLPLILPLIPEHEVYTEVFFGGGAVFFAKKPARNETINDTLDLVVNFYRTFKLHYPALRKLINASLVGRAIHNEAIGLIRAHKTFAGITAGYRVRLAWAFWLCTNFAYSNKIGGGYKYSNDMSVCVPDTMKKRKEAFTESLLARIEHAYIEHEDALKVLRSRNVAKAFHYIDPPYPGSDQGHYAGYTFQDLEKVLAFLQDECKGKFLFSNLNSPLLQQYIDRNGWYKVEVNHPSKHNGPMKYKKEVLVRNYSNTCNTIPIFAEYSHTTSLIP